MVVIHGAGEQKRLDSLAPHAAPVDATLAAVGIGLFIATWRIGDETFGQLLDLDGNLIGETVNLSEQDPISSGPTLTMANGNSVALTLVDHTPGESGGDEEILLDVVTGSGTVLQDDFSVAADAGTSGFAFPTVIQLANGNLVVAWSSNVDSTGSGEISVREFDSSGNPLGPRLTAIEGPSSYTPPQLIPIGSERYAVIATLDDASVHVNVFRSSIDGWLGPLREVATGTEGDDVFRTNPDGLNQGESLDGLGGFDTLEWGGTLDLTLLGDIVGIEKLRGSHGMDVLIASAARLSGITSIDLSGNVDTLRLSAAARWTCRKSAASRTSRARTWQRR